MAIEITFSGEEQTYEPIPKGSYEAFVNSVQRKKTQNGDDMFNVRFVIAEGQFKGRSLFSNFVLKEELKWKLQKLLIATGLVQPRTKTSFTLSDEAQELVGRKVGLKVGEAEYNGEMRPEVKDIYAIGGSAPASAPAAVPVAPTGVPLPPATSGRRL